MLKDNIKNQRSISVTILGWSVIFSNIVLYSIYSLNLHYSLSTWFRQFISFISMIAVFPYDFFNICFNFQWLPQIIWVLTVVFCAFGILVLNKFARAVFILLNILHLVVLAYIVFFVWGMQGFLENFFKMYFNIVASGTYMAFLTLPEVRQQFQIELEGLRLEILLKKPLGKKVRPGDSSKYAQLSIAYARLERYEEAVDALKKAIKGNPEARLFFQLGMIYIKQQENEQAVEAFKTAIELEPLYYEAYYNLGVLYVKQGCYREAAQMFLKAVHVRPSSVQALRDLADACFSIGDFKEALEYFRKAVSLNKGDAYSYYRMGSILAEYCDNHQDAFEALRTAVRIRKDFFEAQFQLGKVCMSLKRYKDAIRAFRDALVLQEDNIQVHYHLGFTYIMLKDFESARRQCLYLERYDPELAHNLSMLLSY